MTPFPKLQKSIKVPVTTLILTVGLFLGLGQQTAQGQTTEHPFIESKDIKSETCLTCHPDKKEGKFVHTAVGMGCENCHQATSENNKTTITPVATGAELCALCHEAKKDPVLHAPYKVGQCLTCHEPHSSNFPREVRAATNMLCLSCHGVNQPDVKIEKEIQKVSLLGGQTLALDDYRQAPKISLDRSGTRGHPLMGHPVTGQDPRPKGGTLSCLSCHVPHSSTAAKLFHTDAKSVIGLCGECHQ